MHLFTGEPLDNGWRAWWRTNPTIWFEFDYNYFMLTSISDYFAAAYPPSHSHINPKYFQLCGLFYDNCNVTFKASVKEIQIPKFISAICFNFHDGLFFCLACWIYLAYSWSLQPRRLGTGCYTHFLFAVSPVFMADQNYSV